MGKLSRKLRAQGYDLIDGPIRSQDVGQIWRKKLDDKVEIYKKKDEIEELFVSDVSLDMVENDSLSITSKDKQDYSFNMGLEALEGILETLQMGNLDLEVKLKGSRSIEVSYDNAKTFEVPVGDLFDFFYEADVKKAEKGGVRYRELNNDRFLIISGVVMAKNLKISIESKTTFNAGLDVELNNLVDAGIDFELKGDSTLEMTAETPDPMPVAVKVHRIKYRRGKFVNVDLMTDTRNLF